MVTLSTTMFNVQNFYFISTECIFVVCMDLRTKDSFYPNNVVRLIFITEDLSLLRGAGKSFKYIFRVVRVFKESMTAVI
jgi:hypothetical protein